MTSSTNPFRRSVVADSPTSRPPAFTPLEPRRQAAWLGDAQLALDLRYLILREPNTTPGFLFSELSCNAFLGHFMRVYYSDFLLVSRKDPYAGTLFECAYHSDFRKAFLEYCFPFTPPEHFPPEPAFNMHGLPGTEALPLRPLSCRFLDFPVG